MNNKIIIRMKREGSPKQIPSPYKIKGLRQIPYGYPLGDGHAQTQDDAHGGKGAHKGGQAHVGHKKAVHEPDDHTG